MKIALDATYSIGPDLSGVGVYSRELLSGLAVRRPDIEWRWLYRPHRFRGAFRDPVPPVVRRGLLFDHSLWRSTGLFHGLNQRLPRTRFKRQVATFHDLFVMTADYSTAEFRTRFAAQARHAAAKADRIIAVSQFTATQVVELLNVEPERVIVIPHGIRFLAPQPVPREKIILHVGAIQKRKNLVRLVRAFDSVSADWRLVLAGSNGYGAGNVLEAIKHSKSAGRIIVTGYVTPEDLATWYSRAMLFAFPSLDEGFGMPVLEAMAAGIPVIASRTSAVGEVAGTAALLIDPRSEDELAEGLQRLVGDRNLQSQLTDAGRVRAAQFTWSRSAERTLAVYEQLLD